MPIGYNIMECFLILYNGKDSNTLADSSIRTALFRKMSPFCFFRSTKLTYICSWFSEPPLRTAAGRRVCQCHASERRHPPAPNLHAAQTACGAWGSKENRYIGKAFIIRFVLDAEKLRKLPDDVMDMATVDAHGMFL